MKNTINIIIRSIIALGFCYFIYNEAGIFTAIFSLLMFVYTELTTINIRRIKEIFTTTIINLRKDR